MTKSDQAKIDALEKKEKENYAKLTPYASGDGSLSMGFVGIGEHNKNMALSVRVSMRDAEALRLRSPDLKPYSLVYLNGFFKLYREMQRVGPDEVQYQNRSWRYSRVHEQCFHVFDEEGGETKNLNIKGAIMFWVNNEHQINLEGGK